MHEDNGHIRALDRGVRVIELLCDKGRLSLAHLRHHTGLSNATLLRILATLQARSWVRRALVDAKYELTYSAGLRLRASKYAHPVSEAASSVMRELEDEVFPYPSDIAVVAAPGEIEIIETNRRKGPFAPLHPPYGVHPSMVLSAHGKAFLAFSTKAEGAGHIEAIRRAGTREERQWLKDGRLEAALTATRRAGYGVRTSQYWAREADDVPETGAIAVPIWQGRRLMATISALWLEQEQSLSDLIAQDIPGQLKSIAEQIEAALPDAPGPNDLLPSHRAE